MQIWSALGTSDGTGGAASADNRTVGVPSTGGRGTGKDYMRSQILKKEQETTF